MVDALVREYLPHAPDLGLYHGDEIPAGKLRAALRDYAREVEPAEVLALYDATRLGSAKDGAVFLADRFVFQNNDLQTPRSVRYRDVVGVRSKRKLLGGREVEVSINRGRATIEETLDFSAQAGAAAYVERFLREAMMARPAGDRSEQTDPDAVAAALDRLVAAGRLTTADRDRMLATLV